MVLDIKVSPYTIDSKGETLNLKDSKREKEEKAKSQSFLHFFDRTTLHGWKYLNSEAGFFPKLIWVFVMACSLALSTYFIKLNINQEPIQLNFVLLLLQSILLSLNVCFK
jgi:hypothetical protein